MHPALNSAYGDIPFPGIVKISYYQWVQQIKVKTAIYLMLLPSI
ncbi:hypothetical protein [Brunnivagina elsteri]|nr:hypothetical protein [Calothrix elsteri]